MELQLVLHRFHTGAVGLASPVDLLPSTHRRSWWPTLLEPVAEKSVCAVCVPPGARLLLRNIPKDLQRTFGVGAEEEVAFVQVSLKEYTPRDAVEFQHHAQRVSLRGVRQCSSRIDDAARGEVSP